MACSTMIQLCQKCHEYSMLLDESILISSFNSAASSSFMLALYFCLCFVENSVCMAPVLEGHSNEISSRRSFLGGELRILDRGS